MEGFTLTEASIASVAVLGAVAGCVGSILHILFQSKCTRIRLCYGLIGCERLVTADDDDNIEKEKDADIENDKIKINNP